jgi:hypothetical protein
MKKETVGRYASLLGWSVAIITISGIVPRVFSHVSILTSDWFISLLPFVYFFLSWGAELIARKVSNIDLISKVRWGFINFLMSLLSPLVVVIWLVAQAFLFLFLVFGLLVAGIFPNKVEFELLRKGEEEDLEFIKAFEAASWKCIPRQENDMVGEDSGCSHIYEEKRGTFIITLSGDITRKIIKTLRTFSEHSGYQVIELRIYR